MESQKKLLIVDDNPLFRKAIMGFFGDRFKVLEAGTCAQGQELLGRESVDLAILDERLPDGSGLDLCRNLFQLHPFAKVIYVTAFPSFDHAVNALKVGAHDYLSKPFELAALGHAVDRLMSVSALERVGRLEAWRAQADSHQAILVGGSARMSEVRRIVHRAAGSDASVLITGETGTGKGLVARTIHHASPRAQAPFVTLNCSALPENLIEAELFGWTRGAFTGAVNSREGVLEMAEGGTLFLDEIGEMPMHLQVKLLSVLEDRTITPLGGRVGKRVDVRIVAATNAQLEEAIKARQFRADLYFRLNVLRIEMPALRDHLEDLPELCTFLQSHLTGHGSATPVLPGELALLATYAWPGNVRELKNVLERAYLLESPPSTFLVGVGETRTVPTAPNLAARPLQTLEELEQEHLLRALHMHQGNLTRAAEALGISLSTLKRRVKTPPSTGSK
ncbi:sigma-54-dependent transcriptional regulator [Geothrix campi]|uniref:sigma-54-dependent transcriptional regulator n=1 Tax=Geothrix campi TaxID=2966450 RepID=UPI0021479249|nr:sigma-54 dependent transcriptional regulator [Geothrix sp. SG10]